MTDKLKNRLILLAVLALLIGTGTIAALRSPVLGLDLKGGLEVVLQATPRVKGQQITASSLADGASIIRNRVDAIGVSEPDITQDTTNNQIRVGLAGVKDPAEAAKLIGDNGALYNIDYGTIVAGASGSPVVKASLFQIISFAATQKPNGAYQKWWAEDQCYAFDQKHKQILNDTGNPFPTKPTDAAMRKSLKSKAAGATILCVKAGLVWAQDATQGTVLGAPFYLFKLPTNRDDVVLGADITGAKSDFQNNGPVVAITYTEKGGKRFQNVTRLAAQGGPNNTGNLNAIILDNKLASTPSVSPKEFPNGIDGSVGGSIIQGVTKAEADRISNILKSGSLPFDLVTKSLRQVSATLGKDSLNKGLIAGLIGLAVVMLFLLFFYRFLGLIADIALLIYAAFFYGLILLIPITLTLPGIAGLILTIGVAADANVVIFERIKEEVRLGRTIRQAISSGYQKGFSTIVDANVVTLITAVVLFMAGTGSVKGFAFTLAVGVLVSVFTAVFATRAMLSVLSHYTWFNNASFLGASGQKVRWRLDITGRKYTWFAVSGAVIVISLGALALQGLNLGIDFKGGTAITTQISKPATPDQMRKTISQVKIAGKPIKIGEVRIQGQSLQGTTVVNQRYSSFEIKGTSKVIPNEAGLSILKAIDADYGIPIKDGSKASDRSFVSASFGRSILTDALYAIVFSLFLIVAYLTFRFEWKYALPTIIALFHDVIITIGIYAITGRVVTASTVAAVLTVLGYSLYDTIIVFDRVRENTPLLRKNSFPQIVNVSLWETLTRSLTTSMITLFPILTLLLFGGGSLKDFAFALLIGIASGAYSSIFVAAPLLSLWKSGEAEFRKRGTDGVIEKATLGTAPVAVGGGAGPMPSAAAAAPGKPSADAGLSDEERDAREAARKRRLERRAGRKPHGRRS